MKNPWDEVLSRLRARLPAEDFRRWFEATAYASDSGDQITVWVITNAIRQHVIQHYQDLIEAVLTDMDRSGTRIRFVVSGLSDDEEDEDDPED